MIRVFTLTTLVFLCVCCANDTADQDSPNSNALTEQSPAHPASGTPEDGELEKSGEVSLLPPLYRPKRRVNIDQLEAAILRVTGGLNWIDINSFPNAINQVGKGQAWNDQGKPLFHLLAQALGKPDHLNVTQEDLAISPLFVKYLNDAARQVCRARVSIDALKTTAPEDRFLIVGVKLTDNFKTAPAAMKTALERVLLLYLGHRPTAAELKPWQTLFETIEAETNQSLNPWMAVCVAAMTHPKFYTF